MNFGGDNVLAKQLREGEFSLLIEYNTPLREQPFEPALAIGVGLAQRVRDLPLVAGMTVADRRRGEDCHDPVATATKLAEASGKPVVVTLSGKGSDEARIRDLLARAWSAGLTNVLAVTGDRSDKHPAAHGLHRSPRHPVGYFDSVDTILAARHSGYAYGLGAAVNPYKYNPADQYLQFYKMMRKLACGANFLVTQAGWDMKKLQELQWYLQMRETGVPVIARLVLLSADDIRRLDRDLFPGVCISRPFAAALQRESDLNANQSLAAQLQRLALQVAGCKLLGYNGVQIAGCRDLQTMEMVVKRIDQTLREFTRYEDWVAVWSEHHRAMEFSPLAGAYYVYRNLLAPQQWLYEPEHCQLADCPFPQPTRRDLLQSRLLDVCTSEMVPEAVGRVIASLVAPGHLPERKQLEYCFHLCPHTCPKGLVYGACGGSRPDGVCEFGHELCFFHRVLALAAEKHLLDRLEEPVASD